MGALMLRMTPLAIVVLLWLVSIAMLGLMHLVTWLLALIVLRGAYDLLQRKHSLARNYPLVWMFRYLFESVRGQLHQYVVESDTDGKPFDREQRSLAYQRAKNTTDTMPFGTERDVRGFGYEWINHSVAPVLPLAELPRVTIGPGCRQPYSSSVLNISAMSFGSLSGPAIAALNRGAHLGDFAHDSGEGGISQYHLSGGGDLIWELGSGYFGCRTSAADCFGRERQDYLWF